MRRLKPAELAEQVMAGSRPHIARAITLVESSRADHREQTKTLLRLLRPASGQSVRVGITGVPGAGKSTFIDALGVRLIEAGHRVAVLAVDPSSSRTGGSILGDRTRMGELAQREDAFIRPSPSGGHLGGVARAGSVHHGKRAACPSDDAPLCILVMKPFGPKRDKQPPHALLQQHLAAAAQARLGVCRDIRQRLQLHAVGLGGVEAADERCNDTRIRARNRVNADDLPRRAEVQQLQQRFFTHAGVAGDNIRALHTALTRRDTDSALEWNTGGHFKDVDLRTARAFAWVMEGKQ